MEPDLTTYRIVNDGSVSPPYNHHETIREGLSLAKEHGVLVPDTRLQAIADAYEDLKNAEAHPVDDSHVDKMRECLDFRLDALTQENNDG
jgi:hypothetical protein